MGAVRVNRVYQDDGGKRASQQATLLACKFNFTVRSCSHLCASEGEAWLGSKEAAAVVAAEDSEAKHR